MRETRPPGRAGSTRRRALAEAIALGCVYAALSSLVQVVTAFGDETSSSVFWPASGVTVVALMCRPRRSWPSLLAAVWVAETALNLHNGFPAAVAVSWGIANAVEPLVSVLLLTRRGESRPDLATRDGLMRFVACAVLAGPAVAALVGAGASVAFTADAWWPRLPRWFLGDAISVLVIAPALLAQGVSGRRTTRGSAVVPVSALAITGLLALGPWSAGARYGLPYLVVPALVVVALQLGAQASAWAVLVVAAVVEVTSAASTGPFGRDAGVSGPIEAQLFLTMTAFSTGVVTALLSDLFERERVAAEAVVVALRDDLTGLSNRRHLVSRLEDMAADTRRNRRPVTLVFADLDGFKAVNDRFGHAAGDAVLQEIGTRLRAELREVDTVARMGGDEFVVLSAAPASESDAADLAHRVETLTGRPIRWRRHELQVGVSVGVVHTDRPIEDVEAFLDDADRAMYRVKLDRITNPAAPAAGPPAPWTDDTERAR